MDLKSCTQGWKEADWCSKGEVAWLACLGVLIGKVVRKKWPFSIVIISVLVQLNLSLEACDIFCIIELLLLSSNRRFLLQRWYHVKLLTIQSIGNRWGSVGYYHENWWNTWQSVKYKRSHWLVINLTWYYHCNQIFFEVMGICQLNFKASLLWTTHRYIYSDVTRQLHIQLLQLVIIQYLLLYRCRWL